MITQLDAFAYAAFALIAVAIATTVFALAHNPPAVPPRLGLRGFKRHAALEAGSGFRLVDPVIRMIAGWIAHLPLGRLRQRADRQLYFAGDFLGLTADEWIGACLLGGFVGYATGLLAAFVLGMTFLIVPVLTLLGSYYPYSLVGSALLARRRDIERTLPATIDLIALCMSAGLTFPSAIEDIVRRWPSKTDPMCEELRNILRELELGHSRSYALQHFADRVPTDAVSDFVAAVVQAEAKGTPLARVLAIQAMVLRSRRSLLAEEAAAKAAVKMIMPLVMLLMATFILIAGPLLLKTMQGGF